MGETTAISWTDATWNPWIGCTHKHTGCLNCYAEADMAVRRGRVRWGPHGTRSRTGDAYWRQPLAWDRKASAAGVRRRVFCASLSDVFEDWRGPIVDAKGERLFHDSGEPVPPWRANGYRANGSGREVTMENLRADLFTLIDRTPNLDWLLLTKRPENVRRMWAGGGGRCRENVWLGYSASDQPTLEQGVEHLLGCADLCRFTFLSLEPLLGPVDLRTVPPFCFERMPDSVRRACREIWPDGLPANSLNAQIAARRLHWIICGGESGRAARPCDIAWVRSVVRQCRAAAVPAFCKQLGSRPYTVGVCDCPRMGGEHAPDCPAGDYQFLTLRDPKGGDPAEWSEDLRVRQFPGLEG